MTTIYLVHLSVNSQILVIPEKPGHLIVEQYEVHPQSPVSSLLVHHCLCPPWHAAVWWRVSQSLSACFLNVVHVSPFCPRFREVMVEVHWLTNKARIFRLSWILQLLVQLLEMRKIQVVMRN